MSTVKVNKRSENVNDFESGLSDLLRFRLSHRLQPTVQTGLLLFCHVERTGHKFDGIDNPATDGVADLILSDRRTFTEEDPPRRDVRDLGDGLDERQIGIARLCRLEPMQPRLRELDAALRERLS